MIIFHKHKFSFSFRDHNISQQSKGLPLSSHWHYNVESKILQDVIIILLEICGMFNWTLLTNIMTLAIPYKFLLIPINNKVLTVGTRELGKTIFYRKDPHWLI